MGTNTIPTAAPNTVIPSADHNALRDAVSGDFAPRNTSGVVADEGGDLGLSGSRWKNTYTKKFFLGESGSGISFEDVSGEMVVKVGGTEQMRIYPTGTFIPTGAIMAHSGTSDPAGWLICDGRAVSRTTYAVLYAAIGDTYGEGDGSTTFNIPDFRGRFLRGVDNTAGRDPDAGSRTAMATGGNTGDAVGSVQADEVGPHLHDVKGGGGSDAVAGFIDTTSQSILQTEPTELSTGTESRPKNANVNFIIKI